MRKLALLSLSMLMLAPVHDAMAAGYYTTRDVRGTYVFSISGFAMPNPALAQEPATQQVEIPLVPLPLSSLGRIKADGMGNATVRITQNLFGCFILVQEGTATYTVNRDGTGSVLATVTNLEVHEVGGAGACPLPIEAPAADPFGLDPEAQAVQELHFVIGEDGRMPVIAAKLLVPPLLTGGAEVPVACISARGEAMRQEEPWYMRGGWIFQPR